MVLILPGLILLISASYCFNYGRFSSLLNFNQINEKEITVSDSNHKDYHERTYKPKSGVQITKITDGIQTIWEDKQKLTQLLSATTITKHNLIHLIHLLIKVTSKKNNEIYFKRFDAKFVNITQQEFDLLISDPSQLTDSSVYFDLNVTKVDEHIFKSVIKYNDGVPTLLVESRPPYKLVAVYDDFRPVWTNRSTSSYVENIIGYYFFTRYYLVMLKIKVNEETKFQNYMYKDGIWNEVEYYTFMNKFLRLKSHIPIAGHLSFDILHLPEGEDFMIEKDEKFGIELSTYHPRRGYVINSVLKGDHILWESATERCITIIILKKKGTIYGINLALMDNHDERTTLNFIYDDYVYKSVPDEEFKKFNSNLVDPDDYRRYNQERMRAEQENEEEEPEVIIEEPDSADVPDSEDHTEETINPDQAQFTGSSGHYQERDTEYSQPEPEEDRSDDQEIPQPRPTRPEPAQARAQQQRARSQPEPEPADETFENHVLDIGDFNSRVFLRNSFKLEEVDTFEFLPMPKMNARTIIDGPLLIWDNANLIRFLKLYVHHRNDMSQLIKLVTLSKGGQTTHFFRRHNANFESIESPEYDALFQKMRSTINLLDNSILLNLNTTPQEKYFDYYNEFDDGVYVLKFVTKSLFKLAKITDGQRVLWQALPNEKCTCITRHKFYKCSELVVLNISALTSLSTTKHFKIVDGNFSEINLEAFRSEYSRLKEQIPFISNVTLNLNTNVSEANFLYVESVEGKFTHSKYYPKSGYVLNKVSYGSNILWSSTRNRSKQVSLFTGPKSQKLVKISFSNNTTPELYFNFLNGKFVKLRNFIEFDFTLKEYNKCDSDGDQCSFCKTQLDRRYTILPDPKRIYLNINVNDSNVYTCFINDLVMSKLFAPKDGHVISDITDGNAIIFRSKSDSNLCVFVHVFYGSNGPRLVKHRTLAVDSAGPGSMYYLEIVDLEIKTLTADQFESKLHELHAELSNLKDAQNKRLLLDISADTNECVQRSGKYKGLNYKEFKANEGYFFNKILFSNNLVYSLDIDEDCSVVRTYYFEDFVVLVELDFVIPDSNNTKLYLYSFSNDFIALDSDRFDNLLGSFSVLLSKCVALELADFDAKNIYQVEAPELTNDSIYDLKLFSSDDKYFTSINVDDVTVWKANSDLFLAKEVNVYYNEKKPYLFKILLQNLDHDETNMFFAHSNGKWNEINYTEFMTKLSTNAPADTQDDAEDSNPLELYDVDITNNIHPEHISYNSGKANGVIFIEASLKGDNTGIKSVSNRGILMWEFTNSDLICKVAIAYYFDNVPQLLKLVFVSSSNVPSHCYKHVSNGYWLEIDYDIFSRKLASFESLSKVSSEPQPARKTLYKLDTSKVDTSLVRLSTNRLNKLMYNQYRPISATSFTEVVDGTLIWRSDSDLVCNLARIYLLGDKPVLCKLFLSNDLGSDTYLYFTNNEGTWNKIDSFQFETNLDTWDGTFSDDESTDAGNSDTESIESDSEESSDPDNLSDEDLLRVLEEDAEEGGQSDGSDDQQEGVYVVEEPEETARSSEDQPKEDVFEVEEDQEGLDEVKQEHEDTEQEPEIEIELDDTLLEELGDLLGGSDDDTDDSASEQEYDVSEEIKASTAYTTYTESSPDSFDLSDAIPETETTKLEDSVPDSETASSKDDSEFTHSAASEIPQPDPLSETIQPQFAPGTGHSGPTQDTSRSETASERVPTEPVAETPRTEPATDKTHTESSTETTHIDISPEKVHTQSTSETTHTETDPVTTHTGLSPDTPDKSHSQPTQDSSDTADIRTLGLDINNPNNKHFTIELGTHKNVRFTKIISKPNVLISEIKDGKTTIWTKTDKYHCTHVKLFSQNGQSKLAELIVKSDRSKMRFLIKAADGWKSVDEDDFNKRYQALVKKCRTTMC